MIETTKAAPSSTPPPEPKGKGTGPAENKGPTPPPAKKGEEPPKKAAPAAEAAPPKAGKGKDKGTPPKAAQKAAKKAAKKAAPVKKAAPAKKAATPSPSKLPAIPPPSKPLFRSGSMFDAVFVRLLTGKEFTIMELFAGLNVADPSRVFQHIKQRGDISGAYRVDRTGPGRVKMTVKPKKA
jgi:hypothetical protein